MIRFNHNGQADPPGWDDVAHGFLKEALRFIDRGEAEMALNMIEEAQMWIERHIEEDA